MQQALRQFDAPLHPARKRLEAFLGSIGKADPRQDFSDALFQGRSTQAV